MIWRKIAHKLKWHKSISTSLIVFDQSIKPYYGDFYEDLSAGANPNQYMANQVIENIEKADWASLASTNKAAEALPVSKFVSLLYFEIYVRM